MSHDTETQTFALPASASKLNFILIVSSIAFLACLRFAHVNVLWADEDYHLAAAIDLLHGKVPYRDFWYDKPPLSAFYYLLIAGHAGLALRLLDALYVMLGSYIAYGIARHWWGEAEGIAAAVLFAFFLAFYHPSAVIGFAADGVMVVPHLAAIYCAQRRWPVAAGACCALAFLANPKALFVLAACGLWLLPQVVAVAIGFVVPLAIAAGLGAAVGAWSPYIEQVWRWGLRYVNGAQVDSPWRLGFQQTSHWIGFHALLVCFSPFTFLASSRSDRWKLGTWILLSFAGVVLGSRFAPHYFLQLLPPMAITSARGLVVAWQRYGRRAVFAACLLALIPVVRFGPRYVSLAVDALAHRDPNWIDVALDEDSRKAAGQINQIAHSGDTLLVWGYRPDIYVYTRMVSDSRFWDSQPLTGVAADRHLTADTPIYAGPAVANRRELTRSRPMFLADGLGLMNTNLAPGRFADLKDWFSHYKPVARTHTVWIYQRID